MGHVNFFGIAPVLCKLTIFVLELEKFSPQHRGGLDAGDTDSVDLLHLTTTVHIV